MNTLFPILPDFPERFTYVDDFLTNEEEMRLVEEISKIEVKNMDYHGFKANRKTASFGYDYSFDNGRLTKGKEIPAAFDWIIDKVSQLTAIPSNQFTELLITEYPVNAVINWHRDAPPFDVIVGISLMSDCIFRLRPHEKQKQNRASIISFPVRRRSLYILSGRSRTDWQHSTAPVKQTRYSITLRTLKQ
jgi:alkylated DNA repair dioxygenase AlkB